MSPHLFPNPQAPLPQIQRHLPLQLPHLGNNNRQFIPIHLESHSRNDDIPWSLPRKAHKSRLALSTFIFHGYESNLYGMAFVLIMHFRWRKSSTNHNLLTIHTHTIIFFHLSYLYELRHDLFLHRPLKSCPDIGGLGYSFAWRTRRWLLWGSPMKAKGWDTACSSNLGRMPNDSVKYFSGQVVGG